jgi:hypothetical protein
MIPRAAERLADDVAFPFPSIPSRSYPVLSSPAPAPAPVHPSHPAHLLLQKATLPPPAPRPEPLLATTFVGIPLYPLACSVTDSLRSARKRDTSRATAPVSARPRLATSVETRVTLCAHHLFALRAFRLTPTVCSPASAPRTPPVEPPTEVLPTEEPLEEEDSSATRYVPSPSPSFRASPDPVVRLTVQRGRTHLPQLPPERWRRRRIRRRMYVSPSHILQRVD